MTEENKCETAAHEAVEQLLKDKKDRRLIVKTVCASILIISIGAAVSFGRCQIPIKEILK